ncbi:hypothetical protein CLOM_g564 [Closterium sp. NIES-68]|nr:hypothetical protein CLOM_g564 [Closterium sp. NIES-68]GJP69144.1 hypothetical protein CLOP_g102 [Closterium sp. NIES-67]
MAAGTTGTSTEKPNRVDRGQAEKAVQSLVKWMTARRKAKSEHELFAEDDDELIHVVIGLKSSPDFAKTSGFRLPIPHSLYPLDAGKEVCLIVGDDAKGGHKKSKEKFLKQGSAGITKVIGLTKLKTKYKQYEAKRQLLGSYDLFLADIDVIHQLPPLIGTKFFKKKKHPIPVKLRGKDWGKSVREACDSTYLYVSGGPSMSVRAARFGMSEEEIVANVMAVVAGAVEHVPKKWKNVSSLHIRATDSLALPIYMAEVDLPTKMAVKVVGRKGRKEGGEEQGGGDEEIGGGKRRRGSTGGKPRDVKAKKPKVLKRVLST